MHPVLLVLAITKTHPRCPSMLLIVISLVQIWCTISRGEAQVVQQIPQNQSIPALIAFGDSIVDQGCNNNLTTIVKCNFPPYGQDFPSHQSTGRFSNAKTPPDILAEALGIKDLLPAYLDPRTESEDLLTGVSFASGGMGYDPVTSKLASALSFSDQLKLFKEYISKLKRLVGEARTRSILANSLFIIVAGSDDLANTYFTFGGRLRYDVHSYADLMVSYASDFIQEINELGARRLAVFGVPPIGCVPSQRTLAGGPLRNCSENHNQATQVYNTKLQSKLNLLSQKFQLSKIVYVDVYNSLLHIIQNPQDYGFDVVDKGCCGTGDIEVSVLCNKLSKTCPDRSKYLFWDSYHPTQKGYEIIVNQFMTNYISRLL
ncbi:GDSL esterase/lipase EXL3-like [Heracleum sosnowskyi]|uniref:GDSL esterase/lipase EXL3-like n=1 Tax=Heracleum sosnowskyi TaxID=360622 RepID=A0AAD8M7E9_9APIA|nr:GDSL esterase/lipase EXL3-like [Heracleum sosnowskyi]